MKKRAQAIYKHFGEKKQLFKAQEEYLELHIALMELSKFDLKNKNDFFIETITIDREHLKHNCNEEFADNVLMFMQLNDLDFEEAYEELIEGHTEEIYYETFFLENFSYDKDLVFKTVNEKIDRTIQRFNIKLLEVV